MYPRANLASQLELSYSGTDRVDAHPYSGTFDRIKKEGS